MTSYKATPIMIGQSVNPSSYNGLGFRYPMFEGIYLFSCEEYKSKDDKIVWYGDEITIRDWETLNIDFGEPTSDVKVVCMGNSLTEGYGGGGTNWPEVWSELSGYNVINKGVSGETSGQMLARFNNDVISLYPDYCIIECGTNDCHLGISIDECKSNIQTMVNLCLANDIEPRLVHYIQRHNQMTLAINSGKYTFDKSYMASYLTELWDYIQSLGHSCILLNDTTDINSTSSPKVVAIGSSLTAQYSVNVPYNSWSDRFKELSGYDVINVGIGGDNTPHMLERFDTDVLIHNPDYCVMEVGINDAQSGDIIPLEATKSAVKGMLDLCIENDIIPKFIVAVPPYNLGNGAIWTYDQLQSFRDRQHELIDYINDLGYESYPYFDALETSEARIDLSLTMDNVHPNSDGNKLLGDMLYTYMNDFVSSDINANMIYFYNTEDDYMHPGSTGYVQWANYVNSKFNDLSSSNTPSSGIYSLYDGWTYKYYYEDKKFVILDENGSIVYEKSGIVDISQFPVDFSVIETHQFEIIVESSELAVEFFIPTKLQKKKFGESPVANNDKYVAINNVYVHNDKEFSNALDTAYQRIEPIDYRQYLEDCIVELWDIFPPKYRISYTQSIIGCDFENRLSSPLFNKDRYIEESGEEESGEEGPVEKPDFKNNGGEEGGGGKIPDNSIHYTDDPDPDPTKEDINIAPKPVERLPMTFKAFILNWHMVLAILGLTMYPNREPILRPEELQNNRPVYEPWLIWGLFKILGNHTIGKIITPDPEDEDEEAPDINILDHVSPNWSYKGV